MQRKTATVGAAVIRSMAATHFSSEKYHIHRVSIVVNVDHHTVNLQGLGVGADSL
eukprot:SAG31_NODE_11552_length_1018_cov_1.236126_3_plen_54_part_01